MINSGLYTLSLVAFVGLSSCTSSDQAYRNTQTTPDSQTSSNRSDREEFRKKFEEWSGEFDDRVKAANKKIEGAQGQAKTSLERDLRALRTEEESLRQSYREAMRTADDRWNSAKREVQGQWDSLDRKWSRLVSGM